jgi:hypothetical protein
MFTETPPIGIILRDLRIAELEPGTDLSPEPDAVYPTAS